MSQVIQQIKKVIGQVVTAKAVAVMSDGTFQDFPSGTTFAWSLADVSVLQSLTPQANPAQFLGIKGGAITDLSVICTTPDSIKHVPQVPATPVTSTGHANVIVMPLP